jgi:hypothetical protein
VPATTVGVRDGGTSFDARLLRVRDGREGKPAP